MENVKLRKSWILALLIALFCAFACMLPRAALAADGDVVIEDEVQRGGIKIRKLVPIFGGSTAEGDTVVEGTKFTIELAQGNSVYVGGSWYGVGQVICTIVSEADGWATTPNNYLPYGTYIVREQSVNDGQYPAMIGDTAWSKTVVVHSDNTIVDAGSVTNDMWRSTISVIKKDVETNNAQGDADLSNAIFTVYNRSDAPIRYRDANGTYHNVGVNEAIPDTMVTDINGYAELPYDSLEYGTYEVVETTPPHKENGELMYLPQSPAWSSGEIELHEKSMNVETDNCANRIVRGGLRLTKYDLERDGAIPQGDGSLNAEFSIINMSPKPVLVNGRLCQTNEVCYVMRADRETGAWSCGGTTLPYGTYKVIESQAAAGYHKDGDWSYTFSVRTDGTIYSPTQVESNKNQVIRGGVQVIKLDANSDLSRPQGDGNFDDIEITITNESNHSILYQGHEVQPQGVVTKIYMNDGVAHTTRQDLPYGRYSLKETDVPATTGYRLNPMWNPTVVISNQDQWATVLITP